MVKRTLRVQKVPIFFSAKTNAVWAKSFRWEVTPPFHGLHENFCMSRLCQFPTVTPRLQIYSEHQIFIYMQDGQMQKVEILHQDFLVNNNSPLVQQAPNLAPWNFWLLPNLKTMRFLCGIANLKNVPHTNYREILRIFLLKIHKSLNCSSWWGICATLKETFTTV